MSDTMIMLHKAAEDFDHHLNIHFTGPHIALTAMEVTSRSVEKTRRSRRLIHVGELESRKVNCDDAFLNELERFKKTFIKYLNETEKHVQT